MKDHRDVLLAPVVSEKSYIVHVAAGDRIDIFGGPVS